MTGPEEKAENERQPRDEDALDQALLRYPLAERMSGFENDSHLCHIVHKCDYALYGIKANRSRGSDRHSTPLPIRPRDFVNEVGRLSVVEGSHAERGPLFVGQGDETERIDIRIKHRRHFEFLAPLRLDL